ncbi:MAG TPA: hypothetical protein VLM85_24480 [Polyangiaceae bacterium]|nr:hypothetical protein [Polyangiaceae bacterium]
MAGAAWRRAAVVALLFAVPRCSCGPACPDSAPHATYTLEKGCGGGYSCQLACDKGWIDCDGVDSNGCETPTSGPHAHENLQSASASVGCGGDSSVGAYGQCSIFCDSGWFDCDKNPQNGCETKSDYGCYGQVDASDGGPFNPGPEVVATLAADPRGLVACAGHELYFDGSELYSIDSVTLTNVLVTTSPGLPAGGLACDGSYVYWATLSDSDASTPNGGLFRVPVAGFVAQQLASGLDPGRGVDVRPPTGLYFIARSGLSDAGSALGVLPLGVNLPPVEWMPAGETQAYKPFTLTSTDDWSIANGSIYRKALDGGSGVWLDDAGASALLTAQNGEPFAVVPLMADAGSDGGDAGDAGTGASADTFAHVMDDAGAASLVPVGASAVHPIVATTSDTTTLAASDDTVYVVDLPAGGVTVLATTPDHVVDVALDSAWAVWTTRGQGSTPAQVWRVAVP